MPDVPVPPTAPLRVAVLPEQMIWSAPALAVARALIVMITSFETGEQGPALVNVKVTVPAEISTALGAYTAFRVVLFGVKVPDPPLQIPEVAEPPTVPFNVAVAPEHMV